MKRKRLKTLLPLAIVFAALVVTLIMIMARPTAEKETITPDIPLVRVMEISPVDVKLNVRSQGTVEASRRTEIIAQVGGRIISVDPDFAAGGSFRDRETLVQLDPRDYEVAVAQSEAALAQARTRLARESAEAQVAREEWEELGTGEPNPLALRQPQVAEARAAVEAAEASLMQARLNLARTTIRAPFEGRVLSKRADLGQFVAPGTPIATMYATDYAEVSLPVTNQELGLIEMNRIGTTDSPRVTLIAESAGELRRWEGRLIRTGGVIDPSSRMLELTARIDRPFASGTEGEVPLQLGLFVQAEIEGRIASGVFLIPRAAVRRDNRVLVVDEENRLRFRTVEVVRKTDDEAVVSAGLAAGEIIVLSPLETPVERMRVAIAESATVTESSEELRMEPQP